MICHLPVEVVNSSSCSTTGDPRAEVKDKRTSRKDGQGAGSAGSEGTATLGCCVLLQTPKPAEWQ